MSRIPVLTFIAMLALSAHCAASEVEIVGHFIMKDDLVPAPGVTAFRIDLDVDGDGVPELFLGAGKGAQSWIVYSQVGSARYRQIGHLSFSHQQFMLAKKSSDGVPEENRLIIYEEDSVERGTGRIVEYALTTQGFVERSRGEAMTAYSGAARQQADDFREWRRRSGVKVLWIAAEDLAAWADDAATMRGPQTWRNWEGNAVISVPPVAGVVIE